MIKVNDNLYRGPYPASLAELAILGFKRVLSLEGPLDNNFFGDQMRPQAAREVDIELISIQCSEIWPPNSWAVRTFLLYVVGDTPPKTYVHCHSGVDRTGFMCAAYRMQKQDWDFDRAHAEWVSLGRHWWYWWWKYALKTWVNQ